MYWTSAPSSFSACLTPSHADWLKDLSLILPMSVTRPTQNTSSLAQSGVAGAQAIRNAASRTCSFFIPSPRCKLDRSGLLRRLFQRKYTFSSIIRQDGEQKNRINMTFLAKPITDSVFRLLPPRALLLALAPARPA